MSDWIDVKDRLPTSDEPETNKGPHIHCWCAVKHLKANIYFVERLAWNPYYQCWDSEDEDDISRYSSQVQYWQLLIIPEPPKIDL